MGSWLADLRTWLDPVRQDPQRQDNANAPSAEGSSPTRHGARAATLRATGPALPEPRYGRPRYRSEGSGGLQQHRAPCRRARPTRGSTRATGLPLAPGPHPRQPHAAPSPHLQACQGAERHRGVAQQQPLPQQVAAVRVVQEAAAAAGRLHRPAPGPARPRRRRFNAPPRPAGGRLGGASERSRPPLAGRLRARAPPSLLPPPGGGAVAWTPRAALVAQARAVERASGPAGRREGGCRAASAPRDAQQASSRARQPRRGAGATPDPAR